MRINVINVVMGFFVVAVFGLMGCGDGGTTSTSTPTNSTAGLITSMDGYFDNAAPDYANNGSTCFLNVTLNYSESIAVVDIESFSVTAPNKWRWTVTSPNFQMGTSSIGKPYLGTKIYFGENPNAFPLAGIWTAEIKLKSGETSSLQRTLHEPGSSADATHLFLYTKEDWAPSTNPSQYIAALGRFPSQGYTVQYSAADGGRIITTGLSAVRASFLAVEPNAYNLCCWLYDADKVYLGNTNLEYSTLDHSSANLITVDGELSIIPASTNSSTGKVDLSKTKYIRFVYFDGAQYAPSSHSSMDSRSISSLITVY